MKCKLMPFFYSVVILVMVAGCQNKKREDTTNIAPVIVTGNLRFNESTYPYNEGILIANFGTEQLNPLNEEGKGYIAYRKEGRTDILIPADGSLSAPKGMFVKDGYLFVCDVNKVVVYNLNALTETPQTIRFPEGDLFVNDLAVSGNTLYVSVTNTGRIYSMDISNPAAMEQVVPAKWVDIAGPNGLVIDDGIMYIASYPADGKTTAANVVYKIADLGNPVPEKFITTSGQYDGIALSADKKTMYVTNWAPAGIHCIDMETRVMTSLAIGEEVAGPADITVVDGEMYIPDLPNSRLICIPLL